MSDFWVGVVSGISVPAIMTVIGLMFKDHILMRLSEAVKKKNQLEIENAKGEVLKTVEANKAQHLKDIESVKLTLNKDLEKFKQEFERTKITNEHKHQIAQEAYRDFFTKKLKAYIELANLKEDYRASFAKYTYFPDFDDDPFSYLPKQDIEKIVTHVRKNLIYLNEPLLEKFDEWYQPVHHEIEDEKMRFANGQYDFLENLERQERRLSLEQKVYEKYHNRFADFLDEVSEDIKKLRRKYDL